MKKHILVVSQYYYPENFRINDITKEWIKRGYSVTVVTGIPNYPQGRFFKGYGYFKNRREIIDNIRIIRLGIIPRRNNGFFLALNYLSFVISGWFWSKLTKIKADIVFNFEVSPMTQALPAIWYAKRRKIPSMIYVQDLWPENLQVIGGINNRFIINRVKSMVKYIYRTATQILVTSDSFKHSIIDDGIISSKIIVWPQYAEDFYVPLKNQFRNKHDLLKIIFTGNIGDAQGLDILPKVASMIKMGPYNKMIKFIIVGEGRNKDNLKNEIEKLEVQSMFEFLGAVNPEQIPALLALADVAFVSFKNNSLFSKTIPAKLQSYMACGMPIMAIASGETKQIIETADCGMVSEPDNVSNAYNNIVGFINSENDDFKKYSLNSREYYERHYNKHRLLNNMDIYIKEISEHV